MSRPLRILQVGALPFPSHQGSQVHIAGICRGLAARGHEVVLACYAGEGELPGVRILRARAVPGGRATMRSGPHPTRLPQDLSLARVIRRALAEPFDVIHAHNVEGPFAAWLAARRRPPLVYDVHTLMAEELPTYVGGSRLAAGIGAALDAVVPRLCDGAVTLSERAARALTGRVAHVAYIPPGLDPTEVAGGDAARARAAWRLDRPVVVYTGNADAYQDLPDLLAAMARVGALLLVVTGSPLAPLHRMADTAGLPLAARRFVHSRTLSDTADALAAADLGAVPRRRCAGFPIKLLNQLAAGVPTVAAEGSAREIPGIVPYPDGDVRALARAITALLADPGRRAALATAARETVARAWTRQIQAERLEGFYRRVAATGGSC